MWWDDDGLSPTIVNGIDKAKHLSRGLSFSFSISRRARSIVLNILALLFSHWWVISYKKKKQIFDIFPVMEISWLLSVKVPKNVSLFVFIQ